jgi:mRNA-degrading endonuclease toxin of MazEF toxin-antitoxin module
MTPATRHGVIRRDAVRLATQPALVDCSGDADARPITVVPLLDGDRVMGFEVRCGCGSTAVVECVYATESVAAKETQ